VIDSHALIDTSSATGLPAPVWFIELFKWLGFSLHAVPMNLWYAGILVAMLLALSGSVQGRRFSERLMAQMPVIIALGINLGIVPLLFVQVGFSRIFYPATVLMAWFWLAVMALLLPAYYGIYVYAFGLARADAADTPMPRWKRAAGWLAAILLACIAFIFANAMSLMEHVKAWPALWQTHSFHGAALGTALNTADPRLWPRWLLMFGLALTTTAAWAAFDSAWFARRESEAYRRWVKAFSWKLYLLGAVWFAAAGSWYSFGTWPAATKQAMFHGPWLPLTVATAIAPGLPWLLLLVAGAGKSEIGRGWASLVGLAQFGALGINAASRQLVQQLEISPYYNIVRQPTDVQWSPLAIFLVAFLLGLGVVAWMIQQVRNLPPEAVADQAR
jgi:hypothetical protein